MIPMIISGSGFGSNAWRSNSVARNRMLRYSLALEYFANLQEQHIEFDKCPYKDVFNDLLAEGYVTGSVDKVVSVGEIKPGALVISLPGITPSGVAKLAEISEYLWSGSIPGKFFLAFKNVFWMLLGGAVGYFLR